jgi:hypothetical protein
MTQAISPYSATAVAPVGATGIPGDIVITGNTIQNCYSGIVVIGNSTLANYNTNIVIGGDGVGEGNTITNTGVANTGITTTGYGIYAIYGNNSSIVANSWASTPNLINLMYGIYSATNIGVVRVAKNTSTGSTAVGSTSSFYPLYVSSGSGVGLTQSLCDSNTVQNVVLNGTNTCYLIYHFASASVLHSTSNNIATNNSRAAVSGTFYGIYSSASNVTPGAQRLVQNNTLSNWTHTNTNATGSTNYLMYVLGTQSAIVKGNVVNNIQVDGIGTGASTVYSMYCSAATNTHTIDSNRFTNINLNNAATSSSLYGIYCPSSSGTINLSRNNISNLSLPLTATGGTLDGMYLTGAAVKNVSNNMVSNLTVTALNADNAIKGINCVTSGVNNIYNNTIFLGTSGPLTSSGLNFGVSGIVWTGTPTLDLRNNIVYVDATPAGTGMVAALRTVDAGTIGVVPTPYAATSNNNIYYAPNATNSYLYCQSAFGSGTVTNAFNLTNDPAFNSSCGSLFKAFALGREAASFTEQNLGAVGAPADLKFAPSGGSYAKSGGQVLASVTIDYDNVTRPTPPDMGALQFTGTANDATAPTITYTTISNTGYCNALPPLSASITDISGINVTPGTMPRLYYKKSTDANAYVGNTSIDNGWKYVEASNTSSPFNFNMNATLLQAPPAIGDVIQYFVVAQDLATVPNVGILSAGLSSCPSSVNLSAGNFPTLASPVVNQFTLTTPIPVNLGITANPATVCNPGTTSLMAFDTISVAPPPPSPYCVPTVSNTGATGDFINNFTFNTLSNLASGDGPGDYNLFPQTTTVTAGTPYTITSQSGSGFGQGIGVWIDYNQDGDFNDAGEFVINWPSSTAANTGSVTVPVTAYNGSTRLRVGAKYAGTVASTESCLIPSFGEFEDYNITITGGSPALISVYNTLPNSAFVWTSAPSSTITTNPNRNVTASNITANTVYTVTVTDNGGCVYTSTKSVDLAAPVVATGTTGITQYCSVTPNTTITLSTSNGSTPINSIWTGGPVVTPTVPLCVSNSGFAGPYAPANWTTTQTNSNGTVNTAGAPANIVLTSSNGLAPNPGTTDYSITATCAGTVSFDWSYTTIDGAPYDYPRYRINAGAPVIFSGYSTAGATTQSGTQTISVSAGDVIGLQAYSIDNGFGACTITISNFSAPTSINVVSGLTAALNPPVGTTVYTVTAIDACGTTSSTTVSIIVDPTPTVTVSPGATNVCVGTSTMQTASGSGASPVYTWMPGSLTGAMQTLSPVANTTYTVTSTDGPCSATTSFTLTSLPSPVFSAASATPSLLCPNDVTSLTADATLTTGGTGPGNYNIATIPHNPVVPSGPTSAGPVGDDILSGAISLPFPFTFYGVVKNNVYISTNGYISFDPLAGAGCCTGQVLPISTVPNDLIAACWEDMNVTAGQIDYFTSGTAPNRKFVVRWNAATWFSSGGTPQTSQIVLNESDQSIEIHGTSGGPNASNNTTVGIENSTGTLGTAVPGKNSTSPWTFANEAWRFSQQVITPVTNYAWDGGLTGNVVSPASQNTNANPSAATTYTVTATGSNGCTMTSTVNVSTKPVLTGTATPTPAAICIGASTVLSGTVPSVCGGTDMDFAGTYAPATWTFSNGGGTGSVNTTGSPASIQLLTGNNGGLGATFASYSHNVVCAGNMSFNWATTSSPNNIPALSYPQYRINSGAWITLNGYNTGALSVAQSGTQTIAAAAGDIIEISAQTLTGDAFDAYTLTLSNFSAPTLPASGFVDFWDAPTGGTLLGTAPYTATPATAGTVTYYAQFNTSTSTGCTNPVRTAVPVTVNALPSVTATATPAAICLGSSSTLTGGGASTYVWDVTNPDPYTVSPTSNTSYTVTGTDANGCSATSSVTVTVNPLPVITSLTATPDPICPNGSSTLAVLPGLAGGASYCNSNFTSVTYEFLTNVTFAGINNTSVGSIGGPVNYTAQTASVTAGIPSTLSVTMDPDANDYIYAWIDWNQNGTLNDAGEEYIVVSNSSAAGPHTLSITPPVTALNGNTRMRVMVDWNNAVPNPCRNATWGEAEDYTVNVTGGVAPPPSFASITWSPATFLNATNTATVTASAVTATTTYQVLGTDANGCTVTSSVTLTMTPAPTGNTFADPIVSTLPVSTTGNNLATNCWSSTYTGTNAQASPDVFYQFVMPSCNDSIVVSTCGSGWDTYLHLLDNTGTEIAFSDDDCAAASLINFTGLTPGATYYAVVEGFGTATGTYNLAINSYQSSTLVVAGVSASPNPACENATVTLTGTGAGVGGSYTYTGPATITAGQFTATLAAAGTYQVTATTAAGCTATATTSVVVNALPAVTASVSASPICLGASTTFTGGGATSYTWTDGTNTPTDAVAFTPTTASVSTYTVTGTDANGCSNTSTVGLTVNALPTVTASATPNPACVGNDVTFAGGGATTYAWTNGVNTPTDGTPFTMTAAGTSTYTVTGTDGSGCTATSTVSVSVNPSATFNAPVTLSSSCPGSLGASVLISSTGGTGTVTYAVNPTYPSQPVSGIFNGMIGTDNYTITLSDALGCTATTALAGPALPANGGLANATGGNTSSVAGNTCQNQNQPDASTMSYYGANCESIIVTVADNPGVHPRRCECLCNGNAVCANL